MGIINEVLKKEILELYEEYGIAETARRLHIQYERCKKVVVDAGEWKTPRNSRKAHEFLPDLEKGRKFIRIYMNGYGDGLIKKLAKEFKISEATVQRIRRELKLPLIHSEEHPGRKKFYRRVKKIYLWKERSTNGIAKMTRMSSQRINQILKSMNVKLRPQHVTNCLYFKTRSKLKHSELLKRIREFYEDEKMNISKIAKKLGIDQGTVSHKLKAMGIGIVMRKYCKEQIVVAPNLNIKGIYKGTSDSFIVICMPERIMEWSKQTQIANKPSGYCLWCNGFIEHLYIAAGPKKQKFCSSKCKNKCKDLRRGPKRSLNHFSKLALEFKGSVNKLGLKNSIMRQVISIRNSFALTNPEASKYRKQEKIIEAIA